MRVVSTAADSLGDRLETVLDLVAPGRRRTHARAAWRWRYVDGPAGPGIITLAFSETTLVGHCALAAAPFTRGAESGVAGVSGLILVRPAHRGQGVLRRLRDAEDAAARDRGLRVLMGLPSPKATVPVLATGYQTHQSVCELRLGRRVLPRRGHGAHLDVQPLPRFGAETDSLWTRLRAAGWVGLRKDAATLRWRYSQRPDTSSAAWLALDAGQPRALCVVEWLEGAPEVAWVAELLGLRGHPAALEACLHHATAAARARGARTVRALAPDDADEALLRRRGFRPVERRPLLVKPMVEPGTARDARPWRYCMGDMYAGYRLLSDAPAGS